MVERNDLEHNHVGLQFGRHLLQTVDRQMISGAKTSAGSRADEWCDRPTSAATDALCDRH